MDPKDFDKLRRNTVYLNKNLVVDEIFLGCLIDSNILTDNNMEEIMAEKTSIKKANACMQLVKKRGPKAFTAFMEALLNTAQDHIAEKLDPIYAKSLIEVRDSLLHSGAGDRGIHSQETNTSQPHQQPPQPATTNLFSRQQSHNNDESAFMNVSIKNVDVNDSHIKELLQDTKDVYPVKSKFRGRAVIINIENFISNVETDRKLADREGSNFDVVNLDQLLSRLQFKTAIHNNITKDEIVNVIESERKNDEHLKADAFIFCIFSHGAEGKAYGRDGLSLSIEDDICARFDGINCPALSGKPKIFIIQACQGKEATSGVPAADDDSAVDSMTTSVRDITVGDSAGFQPKIHEKADMLMAYSTVKGYKSWRRPDLGSWFIRAIVDVFSKEAHKEHIADLLTKVRSKIMDQQTSYAAGDLYVQVLLTSEASGQLWNTCVWDVNSGTHLVTYKGGSSTARTMSLLKQDYMLTAVSNKPLIHVWSLQKREQIQQRMVCGGPVTALTSSPDGFYVVAAIQEKIHVWQVSTGNLMSVLHKHYQTVKCLRFTDDGSHFISAGDDNLVLVWPLWKVVDQSSNSGPTGVEPRHTWSQHSLPITDVHTGMGGVKCRVFTASLDQTCKVWELSSGRMLQNIIFDCSITSLVVDTAETKLFAGGHNGHIFLVNLHQQPAKSERHISSDNDEQISSRVLKGHSKQVGCLCMSMDGTLLISGSNDNSVRVWDVYSGQCVKTLPHKGPVTNTVMTPTPPGIANTDYRAKLPIQTFKRFLFNSEQSVDQHGEDAGTVCVRLTGSQDTDIDEALEKFVNSLQNMEEEELQKENSDEDGVKLKTELKRLKSINKQMYDFAIQNIMDHEDT